MVETTSNQAFQSYLNHGVGPQTLLSRTEFDQFWQSLDDSERGYWLEQFRRGPTGLSREFLASFSTSDQEPLDAELLKSIGERLRCLGGLSNIKR